MRDFLFAVGLFGAGVSSLINALQIGRIERWSDHDALEARVQAWQEAEQ